MGGCLSEKRQRKDKQEEGHYLSEEDVKKAIDNAYSKFDKDGNGSLDKNQVRKLLVEGLKHPGLTEGQLKDFINKVDTNHNGMIQKQELLKIYKQLYCK